MDFILWILMGLNTLLLAGVIVLLLKRNAPEEFVRMTGCFESLEKNQERMERAIREEIFKNREELRQTLNSFAESILSRITNVSTLQKNQLDSFSQQLSSLTQMNEQKLETLRQAVENRLKDLQKENSERLEKIRETVDEKLHSTLEKRLGESFKVVSERLEKVHQGLGEMHHLAAGVGDLKRVLTNVKTRGILGEVQLGNLLEQILTPEQYSKNVITKKGSRDPVEYAIKLPGRNLDREAVYLPIDAKFPTEDYERLQNAQEQTDHAAVESLARVLDGRLKLEAKNIRDKYLDPPHTTDFAILFLPFEGLYAEVLRRPGFFELLQRDFKVIVAGPTTLAAILSSLRLGFQTLAVEKRASEVWATLGSVKMEFSKFGDLLDKTQQKLQQASESIEDAAKKSRTIEKKLSSVQALPLPAQTSLLETQDINATVE